MIWKVTPAEAEKAFKQKGYSYHCDFGTIIKSTKEFVIEGNECFCLATADELNFNAGNVTLSGKLEKITGGIKKYGAVF